MRHVQRFALEHIYCAPGQDRQFSFQMTRIHKPHLPPKGKASFYGVTKHLPTPHGRYQVFVVGNLPTQIVNLLSQKHGWLRDSWIRVSEDMVARNFLLKVYNSDGLMFPRRHIFYSFIDENSLAIALEVTDALRAQLPTETFKYLHVYSNAYFQSTHFNTETSRVGIEYRYEQVNDNLDKVRLQSFTADMCAQGGDVFVYVNGYYVPKVCLNIENGSHVEVIYDQSVLRKEIIAVDGLRTFQSTLDSKVKYLVHRSKSQDFIEYEDDTEVYIHSTSPLVKKGLFFYKHKSHAMRNVTDKDYSLNSQYVNNTCMRLAELVHPAPADKHLALYSRRSGRDMPLVYSALKLHELYKLPQQVQYDVINSTGYTLSDFRAEQLEASAYFQVAGAAKMSLLTPELTTEALGYAAVSKYYADSPVGIQDGNAAVPELYQWDAVAFEYDVQGRCLSYHATNGPIYTQSSPGVAQVEFMKGRVVANAGALLPPTSTWTLTDVDEEVVVLAAYFEGATRQSAWEEISGTPHVQRLGRNLSWAVESDKKVKVVRLGDLHVYEQELELTDGTLFFPLTQLEDRGTGHQLHALDVPFQDISLYLNGRFLTCGIDYVLDFPYVNLLSKKYLDYSLPVQRLQVRCSGFTLDKAKINQLDITGFASHGVLSRNNYYDLRDDRVYSVYIDGKLYRRDLVRFSEEDNTVRTQHPFNGLPYTVRENFIPLKFITAQETRPLYERNNALNKRVSGLFNLAFPEPTAPSFNVIATPHYLFSGVVSKVINDIVRGVISPSVYSTPYNDNTILALLEDRYRSLLKMDAIRLEFPSTIVEIHPHLGNTVVTVNLLQYRFIQNVVRIITNNRPERINLSGYLAMSN